MTQKKSHLNDIDPNGVDWKKKTKTYWKSVLTPEQYSVCREGGTEQAGSCPLLQEHGEGTFHCACCDLELFNSRAKFESGTGWPSFYEAIKDSVIFSEEATWYFQKRVEVSCKRCGAHLGHVFDDGPKPSGKRYCMNGVCLNFKPKK